MDALLLALMTPITADDDVIHPGIASSSIRRTEGCLSVCVGERAIVTREREKQDENAKEKTFMWKFKKVHRCLPPTRTINSVSSTTKFSVIN